MLKKVIAAAALLFVVHDAAAQMVNGYYRKDGTYVAPHMRSAPNANRYDNYGSQTYGGRQRDEFSRDGGATNKRNSAYGMYDNDRDGYYNSFDPKPEKKCNYGTYGC
ncbi:MAG: hypothetical protein C0434_07925 [Xanthomonadaceae bacterium]|nr:hypothetical protein [Xanthomonadaceae bacterium]